ncbi:MAG: hypothetical protein AAGA55_12310 [Planctomycetota bacterium]
MTIFDRMTDDRGRCWKPCEIRKVSKETGIDRVLLAPLHRRAGVIRVAILTGIQFGILMSIYLLAQGWVMTGGVERLAVPLAVTLGPTGGMAFGLVFGFFVSGATWRSASDARDAMLEWARCPHCAHGIDGIPPEKDGCTVCPECAAAWRVEEPVTDR